MDLELTDEQRWLSESVDTLLDREWLPPERVAEATPERRRRVWDELVAFGALSIGGEDGIGAVEACLIARSLGAHLAAVPFLGQRRRQARARPVSGRCSGDAAAVALALLEPGSSWSTTSTRRPSRPTLTAFGLTGEKVAIEQPDLADLLAVVAALDGEPALALVAAGDPAVTVEPRESFDPTLPM